jgi:hypothetical protein
VSTSEDNIFVLTKEQATELLTKNLINKENTSLISFSSTLLLSLVLFIVSISFPILLLILTPIFFIEYVIKKIFEKRETTTDENNNTST